MKHFYDKESNVPYSMPIELTRNRTQRELCVGVSLFQLYILEKEALQQKRKDAFPVPPWPLQIFRRCMPSSLVCPSSDKPKADPPATSSVHSPSARPKTNPSSTSPVYLPSARARTTQRLSTSPLHSKVNTNMMNE